MEDDHKDLGQWKTTSILKQMEDDLKDLGKWKKISIFYANGRQPQL